MTSDRSLYLFLVSRCLALITEAERGSRCAECDRVAFGARVLFQLHVRGCRRGSHATVFDNRPRVPYVKIGQYTVSHVHVKTDICPEYLLSGWWCVTFPLCIARPVNDRPKIERLFDNWNVLAETTEPVHLTFVELSKCGSDFRKRIFSNFGWTCQCYVY